MIFYLLKKTRMKIGILFFYLGYANIIKPMVNEITITRESTETEEIIQNEQSQHRRSFRWLKLGNLLKDYEFFLF
jgi:hypothetical protein